MGKWAIDVLEDGRYRVSFVERAGAEAVECGICPSHTPRSMLIEWVGTEAETFDVIDDDGRVLVKLAAVEE